MIYDKTGLCIKCQKGTDKQCGGIRGSRGSSKLILSRKEDRRKNKPWESYCMKKAFTYFVPFFLENQNKTKQNKTNDPNKIPKIASNSKQDNSKEL